MILHVGYMSKNVCVNASEFQHDYNTHKILDYRHFTNVVAFFSVRASGAKEFFNTEGAVGLLTWFESIESVLHITKCPAKRQVEFAASMLQGRVLTWWNTLVQTRGRAAAIAQSWDDLKKLLMEEYCPDDEV
ncbi:reverse transcriptase domain-containing protein [Tanacetum coccineum]